MRRWIILAAALFSIACLIQTTATATPEVVAVTVEGPFYQPPATPDCLHADGVTLEIIRLNATKVSLHVSGLKPEEKPYITFNTFTPHGALGMSSGYPVEGADAQGNYLFEQGGLIPPAGEISATWDIRFIHARGVECATITLP